MNHRTYGEDNVDVALHLYSKPQTPLDQAVNQSHGSMVDGQAMPLGTVENHCWKPPHSKANLVHANHTNE